MSQICTRIKCVLHRNRPYQVQILLIIVENRRPHKILLKKKTIMAAYHDLWVKNTRKPTFWPILNVKLFKTWNCLYNDNSECNYIWHNNKDSLLCIISVQFWLTTDMLINNWHLVVVHSALFTINYPKLHTITFKNYYLLVMLCLHYPHTNYQNTIHFDYTCLCNDNSESYRSWYNYQLIFCGLVVVELLLS